jgi:23S rRNA pseudouridine1911/1915/1917 synthase
MPNPKILYEDNHLIAVYKPAGVLVQADDKGEECLMDQVKKYLKEKYKKPGKVFLGLVHRLDRPVSGIVVFAKTSKGASRLSEQIRNGLMIKKYQALVEGKFKNKFGKLENYLEKDEKNLIAKISDSEHGKKAELEYKVLKSEKSTTLLEIILKTGRFHQIRAQLANVGHPIVGDVKYGSEIKYKRGEIRLCANYLKFRKAVGEEEVELKISDIR